MKGTVPQNDIIPKNGRKGYIYFGNISAFHKLIYIHIYFLVKGNFGCCLVPETMSL